MPVSEGSSSADELEILLADDASPDHLPDEIWSLVMECLPYKDVMQVAATSRYFLRRVMPKVTRINIFSATELHARQARRVPNVAYCYLNCLLKQTTPDANTNPTTIPIPIVAQLPVPVAEPEAVAEPETATTTTATTTTTTTATTLQIKVNYDSATADRIVPFLSRFRKLRFVSFGAIIYEGPHPNQMIIWKGDTTVTKKLKRLLYDPRSTTNDSTGQMHRALVRAICGAMAVGVLSKHLLLNGLIHPKLALCPKLGMIFAIQGDPANTPVCAFCNTMIKHLPNSSILQMTSHLLCCLPVAERFNEITKRGGAEHLKKSSRFDFVVKYCFKAFSMRPNSRMVAVMKNSIDELKALADAGLNTNSVDLQLFYNELKALQGEAEILCFSQQAFDQIRAAGYKLDSSELTQRGIKLQDFSPQERDHRHHQGPLHHIFAQGLDRAQPVHAFQHQVRINPHGDGGEINQVFDEIRNQFQQLRERLVANQNLLPHVDENDVELAVAAADADELEFD